MCDREKVIRGLEVCTANGSSCDGCPYYEPVETIRCDCPLMEDALALLREQEEERKRIVIWLGKFCAHADQQYQPRFTDEANIEFFRQKMKQQFGWEADGNAAD